MSLRKALLEGFVKCSNYSHHVRRACPQQFAMADGFPNMQSLLGLTFKPGQGYLLGYIFTRTISEVEYGIYVLEKIPRKTRKVNS